MTPRAALELHLKAWLDVQAPAPPVAWPNIHFTPPALGSFFLRPATLPAGRQGETFCANEEVGIFQISILGPQDKDVGPFELIAESLCSHFAPGLFTGFKVLSPPYYSQGFPTNDGRFLVPVTVNYHAVA